MKQIWLGLAACALIASSCQKNEVTDFNPSHPDLIGFSASTGKTKASSNDLAALQGSAAGFNVYATHKNPAVAFPSISNKAYKYAAGNWAWDGTVVTWPTVITDYPMNFYAVYPKATWTLSSALAGYSYTVVGTQADAPSKTPEHQVDVLAAQQVNVPSRPASSNVMLDFKHLLSKIDFKVVPGTGTKVYIQSIAIRNVEKTGAYSYKTNAWTAGTAFTNHFTFLAQVNNGLLFDGVSSVETLASAMVVNNAPYGSLMLMPQNASANKWVPATGNKSTQTMIEVVYRVTDAGGKPIIGFTDAATEYPGYGDQSSSVTGALFIKAGFPLEANWEVGKAYTYNLFLGTANSSGGNLVDDDFVGEDGGDTNLPTKDPDGGVIDPDEPVIDQAKPIGFTVSVADWGTTNNSEIK